MNPFTIYDMRFTRALIHLVLVLVLVLDARATSVLFPLSQMFAVTNYAAPFKIQSTRPLITDNTRVYVGSFVNVTPTPGTDPVVSLTPNDYLVTFSDASTPWRISVPDSTSVLNALNLTTGPLPTFNYSPAVLTLRFTNMAPGSFTFTTNNGSIYQWIGTNGIDGGPLPNGLVTNSAPANIVVTNAGAATTISSNALVTGTVTATNYVGITSNVFSGALNIGQVYGGILGQTATNSFQPTNAALSNVGALTGNGTNIVQVIYTDSGINALPAGCYTNVIPANTMLKSGDRVVVTFTMDLTTWTQPWSIRLQQATTNILIMNRTSAGIAGVNTFNLAVVRTNNSAIMIQDGTFEFPTGSGNIGQDNSVSPQGKAAFVDFTQPILIWSSNAPANNVIERYSSIEFHPARNP